MIEDRIDILENEKLITINDDVIKLSRNGEAFCKVFFLIKQYLGIKSEG